MVMLMCTTYQPTLAAWLIGLSGSPGMERVAFRSLLKRKAPWASLSYLTGLFSEENGRESCMLCAEFLRW